MPDNNGAVIARSETTKQSSRFDTLKTPSLPRGWIAAPGFARLAMTILALPARLASGLIWVYQRTVSPALSALNPTLGCRFSPTCSHYARTALQEHGFLVGTSLTLRRLAKCGPWHPGGEDAVPPRSTPVCTRVSVL
jgi:putative membrane protein insertion efficiency factor